jgi:hypothetical protein
LDTPILFSLAVYLFKPEYNHTKIIHDILQQILSILCEKDCLFEQFVCMFFWMMD